MAGCYDVLHHIDAGIGFPDGLNWEETESMWVDLQKGKNTKIQIESMIFIVLSTSGYTDMYSYADQDGGLSMQG